MTNENRITIERLVAQITEYLARNPRAADTLAGIQSWWLAGAPSNIGRNEVETAVKVLLQRGMLRCNVQPDGTKTYSRASTAITAMADHNNG